MTGLLAFTVERVMELQVKRFISTNSRISKSSSAWQFFWATQNNYYTEADLGSENLKFLNFLTCKLSPNYFSSQYKILKVRLEIQIFCSKSYSFVMYIWLNDLLTKIYDHVSQYHESNYGVFSNNFFLKVYCAKNLSNCNEIEDFITNLMLHQWVSKRRRQLETP